MPLQLVIANPPRKRRTRRKTAKKKAPRRAARRKTVARRRKTRRRAPARAPARRRRRRSTRGSFGGTTKLLSMGTVKLAAFSTGGFVAASVVPDKLGITQLQTGYGRVAGKALVGVVGGMVFGKIIGKSNAAAFATGALTAAGVELYGQIQANRGVSGMGQLAASPFSDANSRPLLLGMEGLGDMMDTADELAGFAGDFDDIE